VHLGTTLNGRNQPYCTFLAKGPPSATATQEGLAVVTEFLTGAAHPARVRRLANRVAGVVAAEAGADFRDVYRCFLDTGCGPRQSYQYAMRIFRGSLPRGVGPFTKDLAYGRGFLAVARLLKAAAQTSLSRFVSLLFSGKSLLEDLPALEELVDQGLLA